LTKEKEIYYQSITDSLTGVYNRWYFLEKLENEMERALAMAGRKTILSEEFLSGKIRRLGDDVDRDALNKSSGRLKDVVQRVECRLVKEALKAAAGNRSRAAKALGLSRQGLLNKIARYEIDL
jgi:transcriptional regulator with PAS, ATPase and Fis domain